MLMIVFHIIEWIRWTLYLTSCLVSFNLMPLFYLFQINIPFGFIVSIVALAARYSEDGNSCAEEGLQANRAFYLSLQVICLVLLIPISFAHFLFFKFKGVDWLHEQWLSEGEEEEE